ncbi:MAG TPA: ECF transporter S component [Candidatus Limnocylindria bacterium]|nr:ECF transporter S component [Candidatus Limnocylindria bacterium]
MQQNPTRKLALTALFVALVFLLGLTPLGLIPLGFVNVTVLAIPVIVGTIVLGLGTGLLLGFFFGLASFFSMIGWSMTPPSVLAGTLLGASPVLAILMCFIPRLLIPVFVHLTYRAVKATGAAKLSLPAGAAVGSLTNTVFYLGLMYLFYRFAALDATRIVNLILGIGFIAGTSEAVVAALLAPPIVIAITKFSKHEEAAA